MEIFIIIMLSIWLMLRLSRASSEENKAREKVTLDALKRVEIKLDHIIALQKKSSEEDAIDHIS